ncbi:hypothetical protein [Haloflavibacter putidus]|uniref:DUF4112 domain-containing protein n=1 Tax=Haloflavibacter putidus TaxID=2576776 RepID=A0A507ZWB8_9FLAO|nr:hypothetical protein [Haloflavibacter putidus]TQD39075.1 hypothetical protein FKR84_06675 [Haloflavibacter putidus]
MKNIKRKLLLKGLAYDAVGMLSSFIPVVGPFLDIIWAPYAVQKMREMYPNRKGKIASVILFIEEILPVTDVIPTFTLMWLYTFVWKKEENPIIIDAEVIS